MTAQQAKSPSPMHSSQLSQRPVRKAEKMKVKICRLNICFLSAMILGKSKRSGGSLSLAEASALYRYSSAEEDAGGSIIP